MDQIYIVDDHPLMRKGIAMSLATETGIRVCGQAASAEQALDEIPKLNPDLVVVDISLPGMSGIELIKHLLALNPDLKTLVLSRHDELLYAERAIRAGAKGYVMKLEADEQLTKAVRRVLSGGIYVSDEINARLLMKMAAGRKNIVASPLEVLSDRELEVFELTGRGQGTREIAERIHLSVKTVESYRARIKEKLNLKNAAALMQHAVQWVEGQKDH